LTEAELAISDLSALSQAFAALVAESAKRVVSIGDNDGGRVSGFIWRTGLVVAAHEALGDEDEFPVTLPDGSNTKGVLRGRDPSTDVALLTVSTGEFADWGPAPAPAVGSLAFVVGRGENSPLATYGMIGEAGPAWRSMRGGQIDARITLALRLPSRLEGGAVVDAEGKFIGMAVTGVGRRAIAIPASTVERSVKTLSEKGYIPRGYLGVTLHPIEGKGVIVVGVAENGPGAKAGLAIGDVITTWDGTAISGYRDLLNRVAGSAAGQTAKVGVLRGGNAIDLQIVIGERPRS
jgi:S1-C subfamily serine protease